MLLWMLPAALVAVAVHLGATALAGVAQGVRVEVVQLGLGPHVRLWRNPDLRLGLVPLGGWVQLAGMDPDAPTPPTAGFQQLSPVRQAAVHLSGPIAVIVVAAAILDPSQALQSVVTMPDNLVAMVQPEGLGALASSAASLPARALWGHVFCKLAALNLLPLPTLAGGAALLALAQPSVSTRRWLMLGGAVLTLAWIVALLWALVQVARAG